MNKVNFLILMLAIMILPSCSVWEQMVSHSGEIAVGGQTAVDAGTAVSIVNPAIGLWILTIGGLVVAVGKTLGLFKKGK